MKKAILTNFGVVAAIIVLGVIPAHIGAWLSAHVGWIGHVFGHFGGELNSWGSKFMLLGGAVWFWLILDSRWLPFLSIEAVIFGIGKWGNVDTGIRAATVIGYFIAFAAIVRGFTQGLAI